MKDAALSERWYLTSLNGIHCVIAAADALLVHMTGSRCKSKNHLDAFTLLRQYVNDPDINKMLKHGISVVRRKMDIVYRAKRISKAQAHQLMQQVERFYEWVRTKIRQ